MNLRDSGSWELLAAAQSWGSPVLGGGGGDGGGGGGGSGGGCGGSGGGSSVKPFAMADCENF